MIWYMSTACRPKTEKERKRERMGDEDDGPQAAQKWLESLSNGSIGQELQSLSLQGLKVAHAQKGLICCNFTIPKSAADKHGNWHVGAIAVLADDVGAAALYSSVGPVKASEEVEIEAKVVGQLGNLVSVVVEIKKKANEEMVALGKQWMVKTNIVPKNYQNETASSHGSKL